MNRRSMNRDATGNVPRGTGAAIRAEGLAKSFGDKHAVRGVSFEVQPGEVFAYLGRNGSGKTTTVRLLTTLSVPTGGWAFVGGIDVTADSASVRAAIGVTMQEAALDPEMTATEHLVLAGRLWGLRASDATSKADYLLEMFGLASDRGGRIGTFSGGMQRRLDIATALIGDPAILFLDEPTTGLDPQSRRALWVEIRRLQDQGVTIFLTTQYLEEADRLADHVAIIDAGKIIAEGTPSDLKRAHGHRTITISDVPDPTALSTALSQFEPRIEADNVIVEIPAATSVDAALAAARAEVGTFDGISVIDSDLEDVFIALTGSEITVATNTAGVSSDEAVSGGSISVGSISAGAVTSGEKS